MATNRNAEAMFDAFHEVGTAGKESVHIYLENLQFMTYTKFCGVMIIMHQVC
jgi:hypothetical protein